MLTIGFMAFVAAAALISAFRWRWGLFLLVAVAIIQDPVRKLAPGTPAYLVLATVPVWMGILIGAIRERDLSFLEVREELPFFWHGIRFYLFMLIVPAVMSATYGPGSWQYTVLGFYSQASLLGGILLGFTFPGAMGDVGRFLKWYCLIAGISLVGASLERMGIGTTSGLTGTQTLGAYWVTYRTGGVVEMISGFFRSPDILGWHAATVVMTGIILTLNSKGWARLTWAALAGWGCVALMFCARRKMITMLLVFIVVLALLYVVFGHAKRAFKLGAVLVLVLCIGYVSYWHTGADKEVERFYASTMGDLDERIQNQGVGAVIDTFRQAGFWGYGLGMAMQGVHHINAPRPHIWQESGLSVLFAEGGVPLLLGMLGAMLGLIVGGWRSLKAAFDSPEQPVYFGLTALLIANGVAGIVSAQIFGDPFIAVFMPFVIGLLLSGARLQAADGVERPLMDGDIDKCKGCVG